MYKMSGRKVTPLSVVAAFVALTEAVLGFAVTQVTAGVQIALTIFVISFPLLVATAFFLILWHRPWVFYPPSEYAGVDPKEFMSALRERPVIANHVKLAKSVATNPDDLEARFSLIDSMADDAWCQCIILMHETGKDVPRGTQYVYEHYDARAGSGSLASFGSESFEGTGVVRSAGGGRLISLTDEGKLFAKWLIRKGRKADYFWSPVGSWGTPKPGGFAEKSLKDEKPITP